MSEGLDYRESIYDRTDVFIRRVLGNLSDFYSQTSNAEVKSRLDQYAQTVIRDFGSPQRYHKYMDFYHSRTGREGLESKLEK